MLNAWLNKNDIAGFLSECENIDGFIDKRKFVIELNKTCCAFRKKYNFH